MRVWVMLAAALVAASAGWRAAAAPALEAYGRLPAVELMRLSPSGDRFAFVAVTGEDRRLYAATLDGKVLIRTPIGQNKVRNVTWAGEDRLLVTVSATLDLKAETGYKFELHTVYDLDVMSDKTVTVFQSEPSLAKPVFGEFGTTVEGGKPYGYFGGLTLRHENDGGYVFDHGWTDLYKVDLQTGHALLAAHGAEDVNSWVVGPDGSIVAADRYDQRLGRWRLLAGSYVGKLLLERASPKGEVALVGLGRRPDTVLVEDDTADRSTVEEVSVKDGSTTELFEAVGVDGYLRDPDSGLLIGAITTSEPRATFFDPKLQARYLAARKAFKGRPLWLESFSHDLQRMIVRTEGTGDSGTYWIVDIATSNAHPLGSAYPAVSADDVGPVSKVDYKAADGLEMDGILTLPPGREARNLPVVVMPHGGPIDVRDEVGFDSWAQAFASRGYAVFQPNYRGSSGRDVAFREAGYGEWGRKMLSDISDGLGALAAKGVVDPKRACIVGASYGGYAALSGVTLQHGLYRCAVSVAGPANMKSFVNWQSDKVGGRLTDTVRYWRAAVGADKQGDDVLTAISPSALADKADAPILLIHGKDDTVVPIEQSRQMAAALKRAGKPYEIIEINGGDHWELHEDARMATISNSVAFVLKHNPPN